VELTDAIITQIPEESQNKLVHYYIYIQLLNYTLRKKFHNVFDRSATASDSDTDSTEQIANMEHHTTAHAHLISVSLGEHARAAVGNKKNKRRESWVGMSE